MQYLPRINIQSHLYIFRVADWLRIHEKYCVDLDIGVIPQSGGWRNSARFNSTILPHFYQFDVMLGVSGFEDALFALIKRIALSELALWKSNKLKTVIFFIHGIHQLYHNNQFLCSLDKNQNIWFLQKQRRQHIEAFRYQKTNYLSLLRQIIFSCSGDLRMALFWHNVYTTKTTWITKTKRPSNYFWKYSVLASSGVKHLDYGFFCV